MDRKCRKNTECEKLKSANETAVTYCLRGLGLMGQCKKLAFFASYKIEQVI